MRALATSDYPTYADACLAIGQALDASTAQLLARLPGPRSCSSGQPGQSTEQMIAGPVVLGRSLRPQLCLPAFTTAGVAEPKEQAGSLSWQRGPPTNVRTGRPPHQPHEAAVPCTLLKDERRESEDKRHRRDTQDKRQTQDSEDERQRRARSGEATSVADAAQCTPGLPVCQRTGAGVALVALSQRRQCRVLLQQCFCAWRDLRRYHWLVSCRLHTALQMRDRARCRGALQRWRLFTGVLFSACRVRPPLWQQACAGPVAGSI